MVAATLNLYIEVVEVPPAFQPEIHGCCFFLMMQLARKSDFRGVMERTGGDLPYACLPERRPSPQVAAALLLFKQQGHISSGVSQQNPTGTINTAFMYIKCKCHAAICAPPPAVFAHSAPPHTHTSVTPSVPPARKIIHHRSPEKLLTTASAPLFLLSLILLLLKVACTRI